jgi:hypothetical protein
MISLLESKYFRLNYETQPPLSIDVIRPTLLLGLLWQLIKAQLFANISLRHCPELIVLMTSENKETMKAFLRLPPEKLLCRWVNYHLNHSKLTTRTISNFGSDIADGEVLSVLLSCLYSYIHRNKDDDGKNCGIYHWQCQFAVQWTPSANRDDTAAEILDLAKRLGVSTFLHAVDITSGSAKLCMSFVAQLFNAVPALPKVDSSTSSGRPPSDDSLFPPPCVDCISSGSVSSCAGVDAAVEAFTDEPPLCGQLVGPREDCFSVAEKRSFVRIINDCFKDNQLLSSLLPIDEVDPDDLLIKTGDGLLLGKWLCYLNAWRLSVTYYLFVLANYR